jgi:hypothetical protein
VGGAVRTDKVRLGGGTQATQNTHPYEQAIDPQEFHHTPHQRHWTNHCEQRDSTAVAQRRRHPLHPPDSVPRVTLSAI